MTSLVAAVGTDKYGGLNGYRRPTPGNPTRIPGNQPAFRGVNNKPGSAIRAPAIKSSANKPDRKTNILIPYARTTPVEGIADIGRVAPGDLLFISRSRPDIPGYAHSRFERLAGVDAINRWMGPSFWDMKTELGKPRYVLVDVEGNLKVQDDWRSVPCLQEWILDGICLSNEERELFANTGDRDGQLYNVGIQGPCTVNNGFVEETQGLAHLARSQQGQVSQPTMVFSPGYMDHRSEILTDNAGWKGKLEQAFDFAADYKGPQYHLYPLQMFSREIRPMQDLFVGLVAVKYSLTDDEVAQYNAFDVIVTAIKTVKKTIAAMGRASAEATIPEELLAQLAELEAEYNALDLEGLEDIVRSKTAFEKMGWWSSAGGVGSGNTKKEADDKGPAAPARFYSFRYVLFTSGQAWDLDKDGIDMMSSHPYEPNIRTKRQRTGASDPYDDDNQRIKDMRRMVGAWRVGTVMDMKAAKMPWFEGGPAETGFRVTCDVHVEWWDWRKLRHAFSNNPEASQFGDVHVGPANRLQSNKGLQPSDIGTLKDALGEPYDATTPAVAEALEQGKRYAESMEEHDRTLQWPTSYVGALEVRAAVKNGNYADYGLTTEDGEEKLRQAVLDRNIPTSSQAFYDAGDVVGERARGVALYKGIQGPVREGPGGLAFIASRAGVLPALPAIHVGGDNVRKMEAHLARGLQAAANFQTLTAPLTEEEIAAHRAGRALPAVARFVQAPVAAPIAAPTAPSPTNVQVPVPPRRRGGNTPEASPDRSGQVGTSAGGGSVSPSLAPVAAAPSAPPLAPVIEAPTAPAAGGNKKRRAAASQDVFASIFGGAESGGAMQPLNPAHRADPGAGTSGASSGRSYARRGKGGSGSKD